MNITIANTTIHQDADGRYCLNDLHKAAGYIQKHRPSEWLRSQQTKEAIEELTKSGIPALVSIHGGNARGTYVCRELVYAYATWISPAFFLKVIRTYDALATGYPTPPAVRPGQVEALQAARQTSEVITPASLQSMLDKPMQITVREYLALTQGTASLTTVAAERQKAHGPVRRFTPEERREIADMREKGLSHKAIARLMDRHPSSIDGLLDTQKGGAA